MQSDYPEDVMKLAEEALDNLLCNCTKSCGGYDGLRAASILDIARAIMQDRASRIRSCLLDKPEAVEGEPVGLTYTNWRGETSERTIKPIRVWYGSTEWHPEPQWLLTAFDVEKQAERDFAIKDFGAATPSAMREDVVRLADMIAERSDFNLRCGDLWSDAAKILATAICQRAEEGK